MSVEWYTQDQLEKIDEKWSQGKVSKSQRKQQVREKCLDYKLQVSQKRRQGYKERKKKEMMEVTKDMTDDERRKFQKERKKAIKDGVVKLTQASHSHVSAKIIIDLAYSEHMTLLEIKSLAAQISHTVAALRRVENPFGIHVVNLDDEETKQQMVAFGSNSWGIVIHETPLKQSFANEVQD